MRWESMALWVVSFAAGCLVPDPPDDGGQIGEEVGAHCEVVQRTPLGRDEISPLGFAAGPLLDRDVGTHTLPLVWADGASTELTIEVIEGATIEYLVQEMVSSGGGGEEPAIEPACPSMVSMAVTLTLQTADGALAESWETELLAEVAEISHLTRELDEVEGSFDPWQFVPEGSSYDEVRAWLDLAFDAAGPAGAIEGQGSGVIGDPNDPDSAAYAEGFGIATFGASEE